MNKILKYIILLAVFFVTMFQITLAKNQEKVNLIMFSREDCSHCKAQKEFLKTIEKDVNVTDFDIETVEGLENFKKIIEKYKLPQVTPISLIGDSIVIGFDGGNEILNKIKIAENKEKFNLNIDYYLKGNQKTVSENGETCSDINTTECTIENIEVNIKEEISFFGSSINFKNFSLFSISALLGFVDGFNPCAMWVLLTFLIVLSQIKDRKKMAYLAGTFILAEGIMYFFILNLWTSAWNFIGYQEIVTMVIGIVALVMGLYFVRKYYKNRNNFTCDTTSSEQQSKISQRIKNIAEKPLTIISILSILFLAFSVNIIEFACSAGIPQTFTKVLDLNNLSFLKEQFYLLIYTFMYMMDDFIVFGLALWGYKNFYAFGAKYSNLSTLFAGIFIFTLGIFMVFFPSLLIF